MSTEVIEAARDAVEDQVVDHLQIAMEEQLKIVEGDKLKPDAGEIKLTKERKPYQKKFYKRRDPEERLRLLQEEQKEKEVLETGLKGTVKWYSLYAHYGFIARADGKDDLFVHQTAISKSKTEKLFFRSLADEEEVEFDVVQGRKGPEAANVTGPDGTDVRGAKRRFYVPRSQRSKKSDGVVKQSPKAKKDETEDAEKSTDKKTGRRHRRNFRKQKPASEKVVEEEASVTPEEPVAESTTTQAEAGSGDAAAEATQ